jgi:hypothetical protein
MRFFGNTGVIPGSRMMQNTHHHPELIPCCTGILTRDSSWYVAGQIQEILPDPVFFQKGFLSRANDSVREWKNTDLPVNPE